MRTIKIPNKCDLPIPKLRGSLAGITFPAFGEIKYDGEFTFVIYKDGNICTLNKYNKVRTDFTNLIAIGFNMKCKSAIMLAELYCGDGKRNALYALNSNKTSDKLKLKIFDVLEIDGTSVKLDSLLDRKEKLLEIVPSGCITPKVLKNKSEAENYFKWTVDNGYEGAVIKPMNSILHDGSCSWVKLKMKDRSFYTVTFVDPNKERVELSVPTGNVGFVTVGVKASLRYKRHISPGDLVEIEHQGVLASGSLRHPVLIPRKEWK